MKESSEQQLTDNQKAILQALADGENKKAYATRTLRSYQTIKNQMQPIFRKLGAKNIQHAVAIALRKGLIH